jgi:hypothetical protein
MFGDNNILLLQQVLALFVLLDAASWVAEADDTSNVYMVGGGPRVGQRARNYPPPAAISVQLWSHVYHVDDDKKVSLFRDGRSWGVCLERV